MILLSIDWDFFLWRAFEAKEQDSLSYLFDWSHTERYSAFLQNMLWHTRYVLFLRRNLDPIKLTGTRQDRGGITPDDFSSTLSKYFNCSSAALFYADSHAMGLHTVLEAYEHNQSPIEVIHFDAHADLGYDFRKVKIESSKNIVDCASWLYHCLRLKKVKSIQLVYPDWRSDEWSVLKQLKHINNEVRKRVTAYSWSDWVKKQSGYRQVDFVHVARSSAWTPPWFDDEFFKFINNIPCSEVICMDCCGFYEKIGGYDACQARKFDLNQVDQEVEMYKNIDLLHNKILKSGKIIV